MLAALSISAGCARKPHPAPLRALSPGVVAAVGTDDVAAATVRRIAAAQHVDVATARDRAVADALLAAYARDQLPKSVVVQAARVALARSLLEELDREARGRGAATDVELAEATEARWWELDRPPMLRTTHAVVLVKDPEDDARARAVADRVLAAVGGAADPAAFRAAATAVPHPGLELRVEDLDPVARDGRAVNLDPPSPGSRTTRYSDAYVRAAFAIPGIGKHSPVVRSEFGYHVILAVANVDEKRVPVEERRALLTGEILERRARKLRDEVLERARSLAPNGIEVERAASELTERVKAIP